MEIDISLIELNHKFKFFRTEENLIIPPSKFTQNLKNFSKKTKILTKSEQINFLTEGMGISSGIT